MNKRIESAACCPVCGGVNFPVRVVGRVKHFVCGRCGVEHVVAPKPLRSVAEVAETLLGIKKG